MPHFSPESLVRWSGGHWTAAPSAALTGFSIDTRQIRAGEVFVALRTERRDGHEFVAAAEQAGAAAALVAAPVAGVQLPQLVVADPLRAFQAIAREHRRAFPGVVVGVTGSAGKTSTKNVLALLLGPATLATEGNLNNHLGVPLTLTRLDPAAHRFAVVEAGISAPGEMATLAEMIEPDVAIVTLVAHAHTAALGGLEGVAREKAALPAGIRSGGFALFPRNLTRFDAFARLAARAKLVEPAAVADESAVPPGQVVYALTQEAGVTRLAINHGAEGLAHYTVPRVSDGMAQNVVIALTAARALGLQPSDLQQRLAGWRPTPLRGEVRQIGEQLFYLDCYNANPAAMLDALKAFCDVAAEAQPRWYVIGNMEELGAESAALHRQVGAALALRSQDRVSLIGPDAASVQAGALAAGARPEQIEIVLELAPLAGKLRSFRGAVFVKGSRKYRLEEVVPGAGAEAGVH